MIWSIPVAAHSLQYTCSPTCPSSISVVYSVSLYSMVLNLLWNALECVCFPLQTYRYPEVLSPPRAHQRPADGEFNLYANPGGDHDGNVVYRDWKGLAVVCDHSRDINIKLQLRSVRQHIGSMYLV